MRCSLLVLSSYLDGELPPERASELEAHLIACSRCSTALGYLREESQRVAGLMRVHVDEHATREMFALIGLTSDDPDDVPPPRNTWHREAPEQTDAPPWMGSSTSRTLPWAPRPAPSQPEYDPPVMEWREDRMEDEDLVPEDDAVAEPMPIEPVAEHPAILEQETLFDAPQSEVAAQLEEPPSMSWGEPPLHTADDEVELAGSTYAESAPGDVYIDTTEPEVDTFAPIPEPPPMPVHAPAGGASGLLNRMRDAVAVRLALMRGTKSDMDDSVQIVSGAGAPSWEGRPVNRGYMQRMERRRGGGFPMSPAASSDAMGMGVDEPLEPQSNQPPEAPASAPHPPAPLFESTVATAVAPPRIEADAGAISDVISPEAPEARSPFAPEQETGFDDDVPPVLPSRPGRHMRSVARGQTNGSSRFSGFGQLSAAVAHRTGAQHGPGVGVSGVDRRLWIFGGAVVVLMLVGILAGKATSPLPSAGVATHPAAVPSLAPSHASASAAPTVAPTAAPTPPPTPLAGPQSLANQVTLGTGAGGFTVSSIAYGRHAGGQLWIVLDVSPASGTRFPNVAIGFGDPQTLYVEFTGAIAGGPPTQPGPGAVVTAVRVLQPSPIPGRTIYAFALTKAQNFIASITPAADGKQHLRIILTS